MKHTVLLSPKRTVDQSCALCTLFSDNAALPLLESILVCAVCRPSPDPSAARLLLGWCRKQAREPGRDICVPCVLCSSTHSPRAAFLLCCASVAMPLLSGWGRWYSWLHCAWPALSSRGSAVMLHLIALVAALCSGQTLMCLSALQE